MSIETNDSQARIAELVAKIIADADMDPIAVRRVVRHLFAYNLASVSRILHTIYEETRRPAPPAPSKSERYQEMQVVFHAIDKDVQTIADKHGWGDWDEVQFVSEFETDDLSILVIQQQFPHEESTVKIVVSHPDGTWAEMQAPDIDDRDLMADPTS